MLAPRDRRRLDHRAARDTIGQDGAVTVTRSEALAWWRLGYVAGAGAAARHEQRQAEAACRASLAAWPQQHRDDQRAALEAGLAELTHLIADAG